MTRANFARNGFKYYLRTNLTVLGGVAIAVAVLSGAMITGDSVRGSLRKLALDRLGNTYSVLIAPLFVQERRATDNMHGTPLIALEGVVSKQGGGQRAGGVSVYGVDERFWKFHGKTPAAGPDGVYVSTALAEELQVKAGEVILIRVPKPSAIPQESLHGRKEDAARTERVTVSGVLSRQDLGEFSLKPSQGAVKTVFLPLRRLQRGLEYQENVNTILFGAGEKADLSRILPWERGIETTDLPNGMTSIEPRSAMVSDSLETANAKLIQQKFFAYLINSMRVGGHEVPYSLAVAVSPNFLDVKPGEVVLNDWAARELNAKPGDTVTLEYYLWDPGGALLTRTADFRLNRVIPVHDDRTLAPRYPGITESTSLADWDPPFPMDLKKVRPQDEAYWKQYRTTPKAFLNIGDGSRMWGSRFGHATSVRIPAHAKSEFRIEPADAGITVIDVRKLVLESSKGSTDFGEYFLYFSFFLVVSALLLTSVFFQLNVDQRLRETGLLRALGFTAMSVQRHFLQESLPLATIGSLFGVILGIGYSAFILYGLRTWWRGAVGTSELGLHVHVDAIAVGFFMGSVTGVLTMLLSLRALRKVSPRDLLSGSRGAKEHSLAQSGKQRTVAMVCGLLALGLTAAGIVKAIPAAAAFFGAGFLALVAGILIIRGRLRAMQGSASESLHALGMRNASWKPNRSAMCVTLIAVAVFLLISLEAFRQHGGGNSGGFALMAESQLPIVHDLNTEAGREAAGLRALPGVRFYPFRLKPGEDASCLNLYEPANPRVLGVSDAFLASKRMEGPWDLLQKPLEDGITPAIADANSMMYVLHKKVGDPMRLPNGVTLRFVGSISGSVLQGEILIAEKHFIKLFPQEQGYRFFLIDGKESDVAPLEEQLSDFGFDAVTTAQKLASFHEVENTYLSTFQALGALGLLLGIAGLAAVLMRNVFERRREMALLRAIGMQGSDLSRMVVSENILLVGAGVGLGLVCAFLAILPAILERGLLGFPIVTVTLLVAAVSAASLLASLTAIRYVRRLPLLQSLRSGSE